MSYCSTCSNYGLIVGDVMADESRRSMRKRVAVEAVGSAGKAIIFNRLAFFNGVWIIAKDALRPHG